MEPTRLLSPWDSPGKNTGLGCHLKTEFLHKFVIKMYDGINLPLNAVLNTESLFLFLAAFRGKTFTHSFTKGVIFFYMLPTYSLSTRIGRINMRE